MTASDANLLNKSIAYNISQWRQSPIRYISEWRQEHQYVPVTQTSLGRSHIL